MTNYKCTLTFDSRNDARKFAEVFAETFNHGYDLGFENIDKSNDVIIYGMTKEHAEWVLKMNKF
jgi:hypothetical protein